MWQGGQIDRHRVARHVLAQENRDFHLPRAGRVFFDHFPQTDQLAFGIGYFDPHGILAGNGRHNPHAGDPQGDGQVVGQAGDLGEPQTRFEFDFVLSDHGAGFDFHNTDIEAKAGERPLQQLGLVPHFLLVLLVLHLLSFQQQVQIGQLVLAGFVHVAGRFQRRNHLFTLVIDRRLLDTQGGRQSATDAPATLTGTNHPRRLLDPFLLLLVLIFLFVLVFHLLLFVIFVLVFVLVVLVLACVLFVFHVRPRFHAATEDADSRFLLLVNVFFLVLFGIGSEIGGFVFALP